MFGLSASSLMHNATAMGGATPFTGSLGELREGAMGSAVRELQSKLNVLQYGPVTVDGTFGPSTKQALMNFQQAEGVGGNPPSGVLDEATEARLDQRILSVSTGGQAGQAQPGTAAQAAAPVRPWWQTALMIAGGIAIAGGVIYLLSSDEKKDGYKRALNARTVDHDDSSPTRFKRTVRAHGDELRGAHRTKCAKSPDADAFESGESMEVPS